MYGPYGLRNDCRHREAGLAEIHAPSEVSHGGGFAACPHFVRPFRIGKDDAAEMFGRIGTTRPRLHPVWPRRLVRSRAGYLDPPTETTDWIHVPGLCPLSRLYRGRQYRLRIERFECGGAGSAPCRDPWTLRFD